MTLLKNLLEAVFDIIMGDKIMKSFSLFGCWK